MVEIAKGQRDAARPPESSSDRFHVRSSPSPTIAYDRTTTITGMDGASAPGQVRAQHVACPDRPPFVSPAPLSAPQPAACRPRV